MGDVIHQPTKMNKSVKKVFRVSLLVVLVFGCLLFSYHWDIFRQPESHIQSQLHQLEFLSDEENEPLMKRKKNKPAVLLRTDCRWVEPWFKKTKTPWKRVQLIFYGKPIMQVVKRICVQRHWKMMIIQNGSNDNSVKELQRQTSSPDTFTILFTSSRQYRVPIVQMLANSTNALVSSIRYAFETTGPKKEQLIAFREHFNSYGCTLEDVGIMPRSFLMDNPQDCMRFFKHAHSNPNSWWVLKKSQGYGGEGIAIHQNMSLLYKSFGTCAGNGEFIVQEYLGNLLLVEIRKFDVRGLVLIAGTNPYFLFYHEGYLRVSVSDFSFKGDRNIHITNSHLQVSSKDFDPEKHFWSFERFQEFLDAHYPNNGDFVENTLIPFIKNTALFILQSSEFRTLFL